MPAAIRAGAPGCQPTGSGTGGVLLRGVAAAAGGRVFGAGRAGRIDAQPAGGPARDTPAAREAGFGTARSGR